MIGELIGMAVVLFLVSFIIGTVAMTAKEIIIRIRMRKNKSSCEIKKEGENTIDPNA